MFNLWALNKKTKSLYERSNCRSFAANLPDLEWQLGHKLFGLMENNSAILIWTDPRAIPCSKALCLPELLLTSVGFWMPFLTLEVSFCHSRAEKAIKAIKFLFVLTAQTVEAKLVGTQAVCCMTMCIFSSYKWVLYRGLYKSLMNIQLKHINKQSRASNFTSAAVYCLATD